MTSIEIALWPLAALLFFIGLQSMTGRYPAARPWIFGAAIVYLMGYFTWALLTPGNWRDEAALAIFLAYAIWVGQVIARARRLAKEGFR